MFLRLLIESFRRQRRRKLLAGIAVLLGTTAVTAMLALATSIGDRIHRELAVYGANIVVTPKADTLDVKLGGLDLKPATGGAYLHVSDLKKLHSIFWANNITGISPELSFKIDIDNASKTPVSAIAKGYWYNFDVLGLGTGAPKMHPWWKLSGQWPVDVEQDRCERPVAIGSRLAARLHASIGSVIDFDSCPSLVTGIVTTGDENDDILFLTLEDANLAILKPHDPPVTITRTAPDPHPNEPNEPVDSISRIEISAKTRPEDAFARQDPDKLSPSQRDIWYCRPYANSIAYQIQEAIPGSRAEQIRQVEQTEGTVLSRISGLMWLISLAALLAASFAVSAAMATAVLERRTEIGIMRSLGASHAAIASLFYAESSLLALLAGTLGFFAGSALAWQLGRTIFAADGATPFLNLVLLPVVVALALLVAIGGSAPSIRAALLADPAQTLRSDG